jgi:2'-5' RNA ligase
MLHASRLFFALWPDDETRQKLVHLNRSLQTNGFRPVSPYNYHVTLVFLGTVYEAVELQIKQRVVNISAEPFEITFDHLSYWNKPKVLCLTSSQQPAQQAIDLAHALDEAAANCGIQTDPRPYNPHVTLARHGSAFVERDCDPIVWQANSFCLVESCSSNGGVVYNVKEQWPFVK